MMARTIGHLKREVTNTNGVCPEIKSKRFKMWLERSTWTGFEIPDEFVVGYGIDYAQRKRNLPYIGKVRFVEEG